MSQKQAKKVRKEARRMAADMSKELEQKLYNETPNIPVAGCPSCGKYKWFLILDKMPPDHTEITYIGCCNKDCGMRLAMNYQIPRPGDEDVEVIEECSKNG